MMQVGPTVKVFIYLRGIKIELEPEEAEELRQYLNGISPHQQDDHPKSIYWFNGTWTTTTS